MESSSSNNRRQQAPNTNLVARCRIPNGLSPRRMPPNGAPYQPNSGIMAPTWHGFIHFTMDALIVLEACLQGSLHHIPRRPHDRERGSIISSGNVFIYEENASGIKRWTDGVTWSPSRIMGNFLVYRELSEPFPAGEKKKAKKRKRTAEDKGSAEQLSGQNEHDRQLVGSLVDSYGFKPGGLIKKTLNVRFNSVNHHIVSYYNLDDVKAGAYGRPVIDPSLAHVKPRQELLNVNTFKSGVEGEQLNPDIWNESQQNKGQMMPMSMPGAPMSHDSPFDTHVPNVPSFHGPGPFSAVAHSLPQQMQFSGNLSNQYIQQPQAQYANNNYPVYSQSSIDSIPTAMPGSVGNGLDFNTTAITSSQSTAFDVNQLNNTALSNHGSYMFQCVPPSSPIHQQPWPEEETNVSKAPAPKRRRTAGHLQMEGHLQTASFAATSNFLSTTNGFPNSHTEGGVNQDCHYPFETTYNGTSLMVREQGIARAY